jgi:hypothetical protein
VKTPDLAKGAVGPAKLKANAVNSGKIKDGAVASVDLADGGVASADIADGAVASADIADGTIVPADLAAATATDLNDASTLGGLTVAQIVAAAGGRYFEARQAAGDVDIETLTEQPLVTLTLPEAGKYLITARMPVTCTYDGSDGATPATGPTGPFIIAKARLYVDGVQTDSINGSCEAESTIVVVLAGVYVGHRVVEVTRQIEVTGPATVELRGLAETSIFFLVSGPAAARITANSSNSIIQAITVRT